MITIDSRLLAAFRAILIAGITSVLASCGSGGVSGPPVVPVVPGDPTRIDIQPGTAVAFSNTPTTFVITGGNGSYIVSSSNQGVLPISGAITGNTLTLVPNSVDAETPVTLTVRDTGTATTGSSTLTVRPRTVGSSVTVTPTSTRCGPAVCAGDDASVEASLTQAGFPLSGRTVRFEVLSGDFRFITSPVGSAETLGTQVTVQTDLNGKARVRFRALSSAATQTALMNIVDPTGGSFVTASFVINGAPSAPTVIPDRITVKGPRIGQCPTGSATTDFYIFGGVPPYTISNTQPSALSVEQGVVSASGGFFRVRTNANICFTAQVIVSDVVGQRTVVTVEAIEGTAASETAAPLVAAPNAVTLDSCSAQASVIVAGGLGTGSYFTANSGSGAVFGQVSGSTLTIRRAPGGPASSAQQVAVSDGRSTALVAVTLTGLALGPCP